MKQATKKFLASATLGAVMMTVGSPAAFAEYNPNKLIDPNLPYMTLSLPMYADSYEVMVNGTVLSQPNQKTQGYTSDGVVMIPLRAVVEELGGKIKWDSNTGASTVQIKNFSSIVKVGKDEYTINKTAPMSLGKAPEKLRGITYVPVQFVGEILGLEYQVKGDKVIIGENGEAEMENLTIKGTIEEVMEDGAVRIKGTGDYSEIILRATKDTVLLDENGQKTTLDKFVVGSEVTAEAGPAVTRSLPPQGVAVKMQLEKKAEVVAPSITGEIKEIDGDRVWVTNDKQDLILIVTEETTIMKNGKEIKRSELKEGMKIVGTHSMIVTASEPGQTVASVIEVK